MLLPEIQQATKQDKTLQKLVELIQTDKWTELKDNLDMPEVNVTELKLFSTFFDELTVREADDVILKGTHIVIPSEL